MVREAGPCGWCGEAAPGSAEYIGATLILFLSWKRAELWLGLAAMTGHCVAFDSTKEMKKIVLAIVCTNYKLFLCHGGNFQCGLTISLGF